MEIYEMIKSGKFPVPECAKTLGSEIIAFDRDLLEVRAVFHGSEAFLNPAGTIQGGFLCAMLDDVMSPALVFSLNTGQLAPTLELKTQFIKPAKVGRIEGNGRVTSKGKQICYLEGELYQKNQLIAKATATAIIRQPKKP